MSCAEIELKLDLLMDGELPANDDTAVFLHLAQCPECRQYMSTFTQIRGAIRKDAVAVPASLDARVLGGSTAANQLKKQVWQRTIHIPIPLAAAAVVCLIALTAYAFLRDQEPQPHQTATGNLVDAGRVEYLYLLPAVEVVGTEQSSPITKSVER